MDGKINKYPEDRVALASVISATEISFLRVGHTIQQHEENRVAAKKKKSYLICNVLDTDKSKRSGCNYFLPSTTTKIVATKVKSSVCLFGMSERALFSSPCRPFRLHLIGLFVNPDRKQKSADPHASSEALEPVTQGLTLLMSFPAILSDDAVLSHLFFLLLVPHSPLLILLFLLSCFIIVMSYANYNYGNHPSSPGYASRRTSTTSSQATSTSGQSRTISSNDSSTSSFIRDTFTLPSSSPTIIARPSSSNTFTDMPSVYSFDPLDIIDDLNYEDVDDGLIG